jgi:hypothetical protein
MSSNIILNKKNIISESNNKLHYEFPRDIQFNEGDLISISHLNIYFSWFNISKRYNNNYFQYVWWDANGDLTQIFDVTIPDGFYSIPILNEFLQTVMIKNNTYLETIDGKNYIYFIELLTNSTYYSTEIRLSSLSQNMDFGNGLDVYTNTVNVPTGWVPPDTFQTPQIIIPSNSNFGELLGFKPQTIFEDLTEQPETNKKYSFLNDISPNMLPSSSYIITCSLIDNIMTAPNDVIYAFTIPNNVGFGDLISPQSDVIYSKIKAGNYRDIFLTIYDQNFTPLQIQDPNMLIVLSIQKK